jgi:predicted HD phosphohydrolase
MSVTVISARLHACFVSALDSLRGLIEPGFSYPWRTDQALPPADRLTHSLQTATLAYRAGEDEEYVVCALLHDLGDTLGTYNHADIAAAILKPFVSEQNHWIIEKHGIFQGNVC